MKMNCRFLTVFCTSLILWGHVPCCLSAAECEGLTALRITLSELRAADWDEGVYIHYNVFVDGNENAAVLDVEDEFRMFSSRDELRLISNRVQLHQTEDVSVRIIASTKTINLADGISVEEGLAEHVRQIAWLVQDELLSGDAVAECRLVDSPGGRSAWRVKFHLTPVMRRMFSGPIEVASIQYTVDAESARLREYRVDYVEGARVKSTTYVINQFNLNADRPDDWPDVDEVVFDGDAVRPEFAFWTVQDVRKRN